MLQAKILEWVAMPSSRDLPDPGIEPTSFMFPALAGRFFATTPPGEALAQDHEVASHEDRAHTLFFKDLFFPHTSV